MSAPVHRGSRAIARAVVALSAAALAACSTEGTGAVAAVDASIAADSATRDGGGEASPPPGSTDAERFVEDGESVREDAAPLSLTSTGFLDADGGGLLFAASACGPQNQSPPFAWTGVPTSTQSLALTFVDETNGATKWAIWDIPPTTTSLPADLSDAPSPTEIAGASQLGSLGSTGYAGPGVAGPPYHTYEFVLWALDVATLPGTSGQSTAQIRTNLLPAHAISTSAPLVAQGQLGGP